MNKKITTLTLALGIILAGIGTVSIIKNTSSVFAGEGTKIQLQIKEEGDIKEKMLTGKTEWKPTFTKEGDKMITKELLSPTEKIHGIGIWKKDNFSRCPSGVYYSISANPTAQYPFYKGEVTIGRGCDSGKKEFDFRVNENASIIEILDTKTNTYISTKKWFQSRKPAKAKSWWKNMIEVRGNNRLYDSLL